MKTHVKRSLLQAIKQELHNPVDPFHDLEHHKRVWKDCQRIIKDERLMLDKDNRLIVHIAAMAHNLRSNDLHSQAEELSNLKDFFDPFEISDYEFEMILQTIDEARVGNEQTIMHAQILFDADVLNLVAIKRYRDVEDSNSQVTKELLDRVAWVLEENPFHFESSMQLFDQRYLALKGWRARNR